MSDQERGPRARPASRKDFMTHKDVLSPSSRPPRVVVVGELAAPEFREIRQWLAERTTLFCVPTTDAALQGPLAQGTCELLVVAQSRPGEFEAADVDALHRAAPLARLIALLGSWCEGEMRSGTPWPGVVRLYWHQFIDRIEREWLGEAGPSDAWSLPRTATDTDRLLRSCQPGPAAGSHGLAVIRAAQFATYESLADALKPAGWSTVWWAPHSPLQCSQARVLIWDFVTLQDEALETFRTARRLLPPTPVLALAGYPRFADLQQLREAGVHAVVSKPFLVGDLLHRLSRLGPAATGLTRSQPRPRSLSRRTA